MRAALLVIALSATVAAQTDVPPPKTKTPPAPPSATRTQQVAVTVDGCLQGKRLLSSLESSNRNHEVLLNATEFVLEGPKELIRQLTGEHDNHHEEISGIAILPPSSAIVDTHTIQKGKTRITGGVRESGGSLPGTASGAGDAKLPVRLRVQSATHLAEHCTPRR